MNKEKWVRLIVSLAVTIAVALILYFGGAFTATAL